MIGVFDSGIGGVTVLAQLLKVLPYEDFLYYSDTKNLPYGEKSYDELIKICDQVVSFLINKGAKIIVIACNTASAVCKDYLRSKYDVPIVAIEPAIKIVYDNAKEDKTMVMATPATINSPKFKELYNKYDNKKTILVSCPGLASLIEEGNHEKIVNYLKGIKQDNVKNVVLGCTHYPLIKDYIREVFGDVSFFDGGYGVSLRVKSLLEEKNLLSNSKNKGSIKFIDSNNDENKKELFFKYLNSWR